MASGIGSGEESILLFSVVLLACLMVTIVFIAYSFVKPQPGEPEIMEGIEIESYGLGRTSRTDPLAARWIHSDDLTSLHFSLHRGDKISEFNMELEPDGNFLLEMTSPAEYSKVITAEDACRIQDLIREQDIASLNGLDEMTHGLPPMEGDFDLHITYSSEESIRARSNDVSTRHYNKLQVLSQYLEELITKEAA